MINDIVPKDTKLLHKDIWSFRKVLFYHLNAYSKPAKGILLTIIVSIFPLTSSITAPHCAYLINTVDVDDEQKKCLIISAEHPELLPEVKHHTNIYS